MKLKMIVMSSVVCFASFSQANQVLNLAENKRLEAIISVDSMNRIAVTNDRITQLFGDEGTFESQNDETTGQIFLKPTLENGSKNLSLTLITEQGITQDLTLKPSAKSPTTVILRNNKTMANNQVPGFQSLNQPFSQPQEMSLGMDRGASPQIQILEALKIAVMGQLPILDNQPPSRTVPEDFQLTHLHSYQGGPYVIHVFHVQNMTDDDLEIQEKQFYRPGDLALSFQSRFLPKNAKTRFHVVTYGGAYHD